MGLATGAIARLLEDKRAEDNEDSAYREEHYYGFSLYGRGGDDSLLQDSPATFIFPVGPQGLRVTREFRQTITPTMGGIVAEERGYAWKDIQITGNFGLAPKYGHDDTAIQDLADSQPFAANAGLSGPKWTLRMLQHIFDRYAAMKADPSENQHTRLVWHNFKDNEHLVVVPIRVQINRSINDRLTYPFEIQLRAVADAEAVVVSQAMVFGAVSTIEIALRNSQDTMRNVREALSLGTDAINTLTNSTGATRAYVATADSVIDEATRLLNAATSFVAGTADLADLGNSIVTSLAESVEAALELWDAAEGWPQELRQSYLAIEDTCDQIGSMLDLQADSTRNKQVEGMLADAKSSAVNTTIEGAPDARAFRQASGWSTYIVQGGDTLASIAARLLNDATAWYELALVNNLSAPYISSSGVPATVAPGAVIAVPTGFSSTTSSAASRAGSDEESLYGRDIKLFETTGSRPGRPQVDIKIDPRTLKDVAPIAGIPNLVQATQLRLWTQRGTFILVPRYGMPRAIGYPSTQANHASLKLALKNGLRGDSRIQRIRSLTLSVIGDTVELDASVVPVGSTKEVSVSVAVV